MIKISHNLFLICSRSWCGSTALNIIARTNYVEKFTIADHKTEQSKVKGTRLNEHNITQLIIYPKYRTYCKL
jgi:hypothetical protein